MASGEEAGTTRPQDPARDTSAPRTVSSPWIARIAGRLGLQLSPPAAPEAAEAATSPAPAAQAHYRPDAPRAIDTTRIRTGRARMAHVIVVGNEKGGAGKSTLSVHIAVGLSFAGLKVAAIDLDRRQRTFARYFENRKRFADAHSAELLGPGFHEPGAVLSADRAGAEKEEGQRTRDLIASLTDAHDIVLVDSPGADTPASRAAHGMADTILTPMNDSFVDFDLLANVDPLTGDVQSPSIYAQMVFDARKAKALAERKPIDWIVVRNRLSALEARNKRRVGDALATLATRIGFRVAPGLSERVIYREMFPSGLTLLDLSDEGTEGSFTMSHVAARQELRELLSTLRLPALATREAGF